MASDDKARTGSAEALAADFAAVAAWWRDAGVETAFDDEPRRWLKPEEPESPGDATAAPTATPGATPARREPAPREEPIGGDQQAWPRDLPGFADWWLAEPSLGLAGDGRRVPPRGPAGAELMVLVAQPEAGDDKHLLAGPQGRLLGAMLAALGIGEDRAYVASVLPAHVGLVDWPLLAERGMGAVLAHHLSLAAPQRLLVMGREGIATLLQHDLTDKGLASAHFADPVSGLPVAYAPELAGLLERPARKAAVWRLLLEWGV